MGARGPRPIPTNVLSQRGSWRAKVNKAEPRPAPGSPTCPDWLDADAKAAWAQLVPQLEFMGVLTRIDGHALGRYCQLWARWKRAEEFIQKYGETYPLKDQQGRVKCFMQFPQVSIAQKLAVVLTRLEAEFGMTPSARSRIVVNRRPQEEGPNAELKRRFFDTAPLRLTSPSEPQEARPKTRSGKRRGAKSPRNRSAVAGPRSRGPGTGSDQHGAEEASDGALGNE